MFLNFKNKLAATCLSAALATILMLPSAHAVNPDQGFALSGIWTQAKLLKEYLDWRAALGWGAVGATNVLITGISGASQGAMTKAVFSFICGTGAAGLMANWKPANEPTAIAHMKGVAKSASVVGAASVCGWVSQAVFNRLNAETTKANLYLGDIATPAQVNRANADGRAANNELLAMEASLRSVSEAKNTHKAKEDAYNRDCPRGTGTSAYCSSLAADMIAASVRLDQSLATFNEHGVALSNDLKQINKDIGS